MCRMGMCSFRALTRKLEKTGMNWKKVKSKRDQNTVSEPAHKTQWKFSVSCIHVSAYMKSNHSLLQILAAS